jgi:hypothetical protein
VKIEVTEEMVLAFGEAWHDADDEHMIRTLRGGDRARRSGARREAGIAAVVKLVERDYWVTLK